MHIFLWSAHLVHSIRHGAELHQNQADGCVFFYGGHQWNSCSFRTCGCFTRRLRQRHNEPPDKLVGCPRCGRYYNDRNVFCGRGDFPLRRIPWLVFLPSGVAGKTSGFVKNVLDIEHIHQNKHHGNQRCGKSETRTTQQQAHQKFRTENKSWRK